MTTQLVVKLVVERGRTIAVTQDDVKCYIDEQPAEAHPGDRWFAEATRGRVRGEKGHSRVRLTVRESAGLLPAIPGHWVESESLQVIQILLGSGLHVLLTGPSGAGKTMLTKRLAEARGWLYHPVDCAQLLVTREIFGADAAQNGSTHFVPSATTLWLREMAQKPQERGLLALDELSRAERMALNGLLNLTGQLRETRVPSVDGTQHIVLPENVMVVATANIGREFVGTTALDRALKDRFQPVKISHAPLDATVELMRRDNRWKDVPTDDIRFIVTAADIFRTQYESQVTLQTPPSFRGIEAALALRAASWTRERSVIVGLLGAMTESERDQLMAALQVRMKPDTKKESSP